MSLPENLQNGPPEPSETPHKGAEVTGTTDLSVKDSVEIPISKSSEAAFPVNSPAPDFQSPEGTILAENSNPGKTHEAKFQSCKGEGGFLGDFPLPKKDQQSDYTNMVLSFASHHQQMAVMAEEQVHLTAAAAVDARGDSENALQSLKVNNLPTQTSGNAIHELHKTKMPGIGKRGRTNKHKQIRSRPWGATEENIVPIEHNGGVTIDGRVDRSHMVRERKKSKYLLYPFVDSMDIPVAGSNEKKEVSNLELEIKSSTSLSENAQDSGKICCGLNGREKARINHLTSAKLLCELRLAAQNGRYIMDRKFSGLLKRFSTGFRRFAFLKHEDDSSQELSESQLLTKRAEESSNCIGPEERNGEDRMEYSSSSCKPTNLGRIADETSRDIDFSYMIKTGPDGSVERGCLGTSLGTPKSLAADQQQMNSTVSGIAEANPMSRLLDLSNANISTSSAEISKVTGYDAASGSRSVEGGCPGTVADVSKCQAPDQQRKSKPVSGTTVANPMSRLLDLNANIFTSSAEISKVTRYGAASDNGSVGMGCPGTVPDASKTVTRTNEKPMSRLLDLNANIPTSSAVMSNATRYGEASGSLGEKSLKSASPCTINNPGLSGLNCNRMTFIQLLNGVQAGVPNLVQNNVHENTAGTQSNSISNLNSRQSETEAIQVESANLVKSSLKSLNAPPGFNPQHGGERWQNPKIEAVNFSENEVAAYAPVMNDSVAEANPVRKYKQKASPGFVLAPEKRGRKRKEEVLNIPKDRTTTTVSVPNMNGMDPVLPEGSLVKRRRNSSNTKVQNNMQQLTAIILNFTSGFPLPSVESVFQAFASYGIIHRPETRFISNSTAQVVFIQSPCAKVAFQSLQRKNPFGPVLGSYHMTPIPVATTDNNLHIQHPIQANCQISGLQAPPGMILQQTMNQLNSLQGPPGMIPQQTTPSGIIPQQATNQLNGLSAPPGMIPQKATNQLSKLPTRRRKIPQQATKQLKGLEAPPGMILRTETKQLKGLEAPPGMIPQQATNQLNGLQAPPEMIPQTATKKLKGLEAPPGMIPQQATNQLNGLQAPPGMIPQAATNQLTKLPTTPRMIPHQVTNQLKGLEAPPGMIPQKAANQLNGLQAPPGMIPHKPMHTLDGLPPPPGMIPRNGEPPNLLFIKHKLEEMTSVMEKAGSNLSPEMRGMLESEIGRLQEKVNSLVDASS